MIDFDSAEIASQKLLNDFVSEMYKKSPLYVDRSRSSSKERHVIRRSQLDEIIEYVEKLYTNDDLKLFFDYQNDANELIVNAFNLSKKAINTSAPRPDFIDEEGNFFEIKAANSLRVDLTYESVINTLTDRGDLNKSEYAVLVYLAKSRAPLSRKDFSKALRFSERSITYALQSLDKKGLVANLNKTKSPRLNRYELIKKR